MSVGDGTRTEPNIFVPRRCPTCGQHVETVLDRFWSKVNKGSEDECWPWIGSKRGGYGVFKIGGKGIRAHRLIYELVNGREIAEGAVIHHTCERRDCVNPAHLEEFEWSAHVTHHHKGVPERRVA